MYVHIFFPFWVIFLPWYYIKVTYEGIGQVQKLEEKKQPNKKTNKQNHRSGVKYVPASGTRERTDLELGWKEEEWTAPGQIGHSETGFAPLPLLPSHSCPFKLYKGSVNQFSHNHLVHLRV